MTKLTTDSLTEIIITCNTADGYNAGIVFVSQYELNPFMKEIEDAHSNQPIYGVEQIISVRHLPQNEDYVMKFYNGNTLTLLTLDTVENYKRMFNKVLYCGIDISDWFCEDQIKQTTISYVPNDPSHALDEFISSFKIIDT